MTEYQALFEEDNAEYKAFVDKFKPKKTTDDCYTPAPIFDCIRDYATRRFNFPPEAIVRPFFPGGDFERYDYPPGCVVLDNPPFSILARIIDFYLANSIRFFLFCPSLTAFGYLRRTGIAVLNVGGDIIYDNGAVVNTSFVHNLGDPEVVAETEPQLSREITRVSKELASLQKKQVRKLELPLHVMTSARMNWLSIHGEKFQIRRKSCLFVRELDNLKGGIFGGGLFLSERAAAERAAAERAAAERAAAERAAAERAALSDRERELVRLLSAGDK